jgi:pyruvate/2-oxoacid:ferredoxin oxidoreductase beta subunit
MFPLYEVENGKYNITVKPEPLKPVVDYIKSQGRFRHLSDNEISKIQERVNYEWANLRDLANLESCKPTSADPT